MKTLLSSIGVAVCVGLVLVATVLPVSSQEDRAVAIAKIARASTVYIETDGGAGSGFVIADEYVATNHHVIEGASRMSVRLVGRSESFKASLFRDDKDNDLAVLRVRGLEAPALAMSERIPAQGSKVYVYGNPLKLEGTFSSGEVSALRGNRYIQITAPISPGSSGGPVFNDQGYVIGVAQSQLLDKERRSQNLNLAIPILYLVVLVDGHIELANLRPAESQPIGLAGTAWQGNQYFDGTFTATLTTRFEANGRLLWIVGNLVYVGEWTQNGNSFQVSVPSQRSGNVTFLGTSVTGTIDDTTIKILWPDPRARWDVRRIQ